MENNHFLDSHLIDNFRIRAKKKNILEIDFLLQHVACDLEDRLKCFNRYFYNAIDLHSHNDLSAESMIRSGSVKKVKRIETLKEFLITKFPHQVCSRENLILELNQADLIVSLLSLQLTNDIFNVIKQVRKILKPDSLFIAALCGDGTLYELRESFFVAESEIYNGVNPRIIPFINIKNSGFLLQQAGFNFPVTDVENITVHYNTAFDLIKDLRNMGMQNSLVQRSRRPITRKFLKRVGEIYEKKFKVSNNRVRATFSIVWMSGWSPK